MNMHTLICTCELCQTSERLILEQDNCTCALCVARREFKEDGALPLDLAVQLIARGHILVVDDDA